MSNVIRSEQYLSNLGPIGNRLDKWCGKGQPTQHQISVLKAVWENGSIKEATVPIGLARHTIEWHLAQLRIRLGHPSWSLTDLFRWGVRSGFLFLLLMSCFTAAAKRHPPPPPPQVISRAYAWWPPVPGISEYAVVCAGRTNLTFGTNQMITGLTNGFNYSVYVESISNGLFSPPSCAIFFTAGSNSTNSCPVMPATSGL